MQVTEDVHASEDVLRHLMALKRYACVLTDQPCEADDLVQETLHKALKAIDRGTEMECPKAYLMSTLHNLRMDNLRRRTRRGQEVEVDDEIMGICPASQDLRVTCKEVMKTIAELPADQREVLLLAGLREMTYGEMAETLNIPEGTVTSRLSRARASLRERLGWESAVS